MREIKFRGIAKHDGYYATAGEWVIGFYGVKLNPNTGKDQHYIIKPVYTTTTDSSYFVDIEAIAETVGQFTGLKDKNGKEIYEGDIVKYTFDLPESISATENGLKIRKHQVFWSDWRSSFSVGNKLANNDLFKYVRNGNRVEIIGNIYENPELIQL